MPEDVVGKLKRAVRGLLYPSESDEPLEVIKWNVESNHLTGRQLGKLGRHPQKATVKAIPVDEFFEKLICEEEWFDEDDKKTTAKYLRLKELLSTLLTHLQAFKVDE